MGDPGERAADVLARGGRSLAEDRSVEGDLYALRWLVRVEDPPHGLEPAVEQAKPIEVAPFHPHRLTPSVERDPTPVHAVSSTQGLSTRRASLASGVPQVKARETPASAALREEATSALAETDVRWPRSGDRPMVEDASSGRAAASSGRAASR